MNNQLSFEFLTNTNYSIDNFIVFNENIEAFYYLNSDKEDENIFYNQIVFLSGEKKCGKTHLALIWKQNHNAKVIDINSISNLEFDIFIKEVGSLIEKFDYYLIDNFPERIDEDKFFYLLNTILLNNSSVLLVCENDISKKEFKFPDLKSRISAAIHLRIKNLSKDIKPMLINKLFADKQIFINGKILEYLNNELPTNYNSIYNYIDMVSKEFNGQKLSLSILNNFLSNLNLNYSTFN